jgi:hypothetical protein
MAWRKSVKNMERWETKTFSLKKETISLLEKLKKKKRKSYDKLLRELAIKELLSNKRKRKKEKGLIDYILNE